jgi:ribosomal protein S18 acetylase RimI-like enzyme
VPIAQVYHASISELCSHDYEQEVIQAWLEASNPDARKRYIESGCLWVVESFSRTQFDLTSNHSSTENGTLVQGHQTNELAGFMVTVPGELISLFIHPDFSGLGVGKKLAEIGIQFAQKGHKVIRLEATLTAVPFYQKLGFVAQSRGFYSHGKASLNIPVVNMILTLPH